MNRDSRAARLAALGDVHRLAIVDDLFVSDHTPRELMHRHRLTSSLLAHHLDVLEKASLIRRRQSSGDRRNRYVVLIPQSLNGLLPDSQVGSSSTTFKPLRALFVCRQNSARSQLAAALFRSHHLGKAESAGTEPADTIHPLTLEAARREHLTVPLVRPRHLRDVQTKHDVIISVCDEAREHVEAREEWLHWSLPDPAKSRSLRAFKRTIDELNERIIMFKSRQIEITTPRGTAP